MASTRKRSLVPIVLFCVLITLVVAKVIQAFRPVQLQPPQQAITMAPEENQNVSTDPSQVRVIAQLAGNSVSAKAGQASSPVVNTCSKTPPKEEELKIESCKDASVDMGSYITPSCGGPGKSCGTVSGTSVTLTDSYIGNVTNEVIDLGGGMIKQRSNDIFFLYRKQGGYISLLQDTIWGGGPAGGFFTCDGTSDQAFYRVYDANGNWGNKQYPANASCGQVYSNQAVLHTYKKVSNSGLDINNPNTPPDVPESQLTACNVAGQTGIVSGNSGKLIFQGPAVCNGKPFDMIAVLNVSGSGAGEVNMYCKEKDGQGKGLCAFYQTLDFSKKENRPINWDTNTDICNLKAGGSRATLPTYFEYNIQRECGQTPVKVLNNFLDEYSVSCMPESDYVLEIVRQAQCGRTGKGCGDWNATGDLRMSAGGALFGLFRNESAVSSRYNTMNGLKDKNRQESIEAYLTAKVDHIPLSQQASNTQKNEFNKANANDLTAYQSPLYKLSTLEQQCDLIYDKLVAVKELCDPFNRIEGEESAECAINQFLPNTSTRYVDMLTAMKDPADDTKNKCGILMNPDPSNANAVKLRDQILNIDPAMEVAYRPAFIVVASYVGDPIMTNPQFDSQLPNGGPDRSNFWQVDYLEVKVPTFGSDFLYKADAKSASNKTRAGSTYRDPLRFMADVMTTPEIQEKYRKEEENDRNNIRSNAAQFDPNALTPGPIIGLGGKPIKCRSGKGAYSADACDNIAKALVTFINSSNTVPVSPGEGENGSSITRQYSPPRGWLPSSKCEVFEKNLYGNSELTANPVPEAYRWAEQANSIGSQLIAKDVGQYVKKKEAHSELDTNVPVLNGDPAPNAANFGHTQVFFVSPHNYTLLYAQNAMISMLSDEQKEAYLKNSAFSSAMKTTGIDEYSSGMEKSSYWTIKGTGENGPPGPADPEISDEYQVSMDMKRVKDPTTGKELTSPLMWQVAGSVANLPTRVFAFITNKIGSKMYNFTLGCNGEFGTENWLLGKCKEVASTGPSASASPFPTTQPGGQCIEFKVDDAFADDAERVLRSNIPAQQHQSDTFAGWDRYFSVADQPTIQHLFYPDCQGGQYCYSYILDTIKSVRVDGKRLNPYLVMAIALNETGGLISKKPGYIGPHFGCGLGPSDNPGQIIGDGSIESKLQCLIGFFQSNESLSSEEALSKYGYSNGARNGNITKIANIISGGRATTACGGDSAAESGREPQATPSDARTP